MPCSYYDPTLNAVCIVTSLEGHKTGHLGQWISQSQNFYDRNVTKINVNRHGFPKPNLNL